jgi:hypothetical protein
MRDGPKIRLAHNGAQEQGVTLLDSGAALPVHSDDVHEIGVVGKGASLFCGLSRIPRFGELRDQVRNLL